MKIYTRCLFCAYFERYYPMGDPPRDPNTGRCFALHRDVATGYICDKFVLHDLWADEGLPGSREERKEGDRADRSILLRVRAGNPLDNGPRGGYNIRITDIKDRKHE